MAAAKNSFAQTVTFFNEVHAYDIAVIFANDNVLSNVYQTTGQVTGVSGTQCGIRQTFTSTVSRNKVFQNGQAFTEVCFDRTVDDFTGRIGHQTTHTSQLTNLLGVTARTGVSHHVNTVEFIHGACHEFFGNFVSCFFPQRDNFTITFIIAHQAATEQSFSLINFAFSCFQDFCFFCRNFNVRSCDGDTSAACIVVTHFLNNVKNFSSTQVAKEFVSFSNEVTQFFFVHEFAKVPFFYAISINFFMVVTHFFGQFAIEDGVTNGGGNEAHAFSFFFANDLVIGDIYFDLCLQRNNAMVVCQLSFVNAAEAHTFTFSAFTNDGQVVGTQNHILGRNCYRFAVFRSQDVVYGKHQHASFCLRFNRKGQMDCHLVTVKVSVVCSTNEGMQFDCTAFGEDGFECLDTQSVKGRCTVKKYRMFFDNFFKDIPYDGACTFYHAFSTLNVGSFAAVYQTFHNERFEEFQSHFFRQTALMHFQFRTNYDYGTARVVNAFTKQVLTETTLFTFEHIGQRFQGTVARTGYRTATTTIVNQSVNSFLEHTFFVTNDDVRSVELEQTFQTIVTVNYTTIQIVEVGGCKTTAVKLYHGAQFRRNYRNYIQNHPFRTVTGFKESFANFQTTYCTYFTLAAYFFHFSAQFISQSLQVDFFQQFFNCGSTHTNFECVAIFITSFYIFTFAEQLFFGQRSFARIEDDVVSKIQYFFQAAGRNVKNQTHTARNTFEVPNVGNRCCQFDMTHTVTTNFATGYFNAAFVADNTFITNAFIFTAMTFPVFGRTKDSFAEQTVTFRFQSSVVNGFRFFNFTIGPSSDLVRRCQTNTHRLKIIYI